MFILINNTAAGDVIVNDYMRKVMVNKIACNFLSYFAESQPPDRTGNHMAPGTTSYQLLVVILAISAGEIEMIWLVSLLETGTVRNNQWPLLLTWFNFNHSMDK